jgi:hypothetical protein
MAGVVGTFLAGRYAITASLVDCLNTASLLVHFPATAIYHHLAPNIF